MSGYKHATITISQEEYRHLHEADMKLRYEKKKNTEKTHQSQALLQVYRQMEDRQEEYEKILVNMERDIAEMEADISREILQQQDQYYQNLLEQIQYLSAENEENQQLLVDARQEFEEALQEQKSKNKNRFNALHQQLSVITENTAQQEEMAQKWIESATLISQFIDTNYDHHKFCPTQFDQASQRLGLAVDNYKRGFFEAGMQSAQEAYLKLSELRIRVEEETYKWQAAYQLILDQVQSVYYEVSNTPVIPALGLEGEDLHINIDLDYWSNGKYAVLSSASKKLFSILENNHQEVSFDDLDMISSRIIPKYRQEFDNIIFEARQNATNSQIKINIAYVAMKALESHGFSLDNASYRNDDMRDAFSAVLNGLDGSNIILEISPDPDGNSTNNLSVETRNDNIHSEHEYLLRWQEICGSLQEVGVNIGQVQVSPRVNPVSAPPIADYLKVKPRQLPNPMQEYYYVHSNRPQSVSTQL
jgi:hypothetical protein